MAFLKRQKKTNIKFKNVSDFYQNEIKYLRFFGENIMFIECVA